MTLVVGLAIGLFVGFTFGFLTCAVLASGADRERLYFHELEERAPSPPLALVPPASLSTGPSTRPSPDGVRPSSS